MSSLTNFPFPTDWSEAEKNAWLLLAQNVQSRDLACTLVTGVFDMFHEEHQRFLEKAALLSPLLVVGVESDKRVRELKGEGRPKQPQAERVAQILRFRPDFLVAVLPENFSRPEHHKALLELLKPQFLAVSESSPHQEKKKLAIEAVGGELRVVHEHNPAVSTTQLLAQQAASEVQ